MSVLTLKSSSYFIFVKLFFKLMFPNIYLIFLLPFFSFLISRPLRLIATPGRLLHIVVEMNLSLSTIQYFVLDEADRLFEMGFADQLKVGVSCKLCS